MDFPKVTVGGFVVADDGTILVVRSHKWRDLYVLPGGKVDWGESCEDAFIREVFEETQLKVANVRFALVQEAIFLKDFFENKHFVMHDYIADLAPGFHKEDVVLNHEAQEYLWVTPDEMRKLPTIKEMIVLLDYYEQQGGLIGFDQLKIPCLIGTQPEEKKKTQDIFVDIRIRASFRCAATDDVEKTVDYTKVAALCETLVHSKHYHLLETYAHDVLEALFQTFSIAWAWIKVRKPAALPNSAGSVIEFERHR